MMTENGEDSSPSQPCGALPGEDPGKEDPAVSNVKRPFKAPLVDPKTSKGLHNALALPWIAQDQEGKISPYQPRPPPVPRPLSKAGKTSSVEERVRARRLRSSQESLTDPAETGSSTDSLKEDQTFPPPGGYTLSGAANFRNGQGSTVGPLPAPPTGSPIFRGRGHSLSEYELRPHNQQSDSTEQRVRSSKVLLSPVQPSGPLPALEKSFASASLRAANRIDRDCVDYGVLARGGRVETLHRNLSDSLLLENMVSDSTSVNSMKSTFSVLNPIRPQDVRNR